LFVAIGRSERFAAALLVPLQDVDRLAERLADVECSC